jgi:hypothetical protein
MGPGSMFVVAACLYLVAVYCACLLPVSVLYVVQKVSLCIALHSSHVLL